MPTSVQIVCVAWWSATRQSQRGPMSRCAFRSGGGKKARSRALRPAVLAIQRVCDPQRCRIRQHASQIIFWRQHTAACFRPKRGHTPCRRCAHGHARARWAHSRFPPLAIAARQALNPPSPSHKNPPQQPPLRSPSQVASIPPRERTARVAQHVISTTLFQDTTKYNNDGGSLDVGDGARGRAAPPAAAARV